MSTLRNIAVFSALSFAAISFSQTLTIGDRAPELKVSAWVKGTPVKSLGKGVHVVEFWATWCGPCIQSIPHVSALAKQFKGKVTFTGVSVWESKPADYTVKVPAFVKEMGAKMGYNVASDANKFMAENWLKPAGENGIPSAFIIRDGAVAWIGHPMAMDAPLKAVVAGTYDIKAARAERMNAQSAEKAEMEKMNKLQAKMEPVMKALKGGETEKGLEMIQAIIKEDPTLDPQLGPFKLSVMQDMGHADTGNYLLSLTQSEWGGTANMMNNMLWGVIDSKVKQTFETYQVCVGVAERLMELAPTNPTYLDTVAFAFHKFDKRETALEIQTKAVTLAKAQGMDAATLADLMTRYKMYGGK